MYIAQCVVRKTIQDLKQFWVQINLIRTCQKCVNQTSTQGSFILHSTCVLHLLHSLLSLPVKRSSHTAENHQAKGNPWRGLETEGKKKRIFLVLCAADQNHGSHMIKGI